MGVGGDQEERGEADAAERVRAPRARAASRSAKSTAGDDRVKGALRARGGRRRARPADQTTNTASTAAARPSYGKPTSDDGDERDDRHGQPGGGEHEDRPGRLDRDAAHQRRRLTLAACASLRSAGRGGGAGRVDQPVDGRCRGGPRRRSGGARRWRRSRWRSGTRSSAARRGLVDAWRARATTGSRAARTRRSG